MAKGGPKQRAQFDVSPEDFVRAWNTSQNAQEAADKLGMPTPLVYARASKYRKAGVNLKTMRRGKRPGIDVDGLNQLIEEIRKQQAAEAAASAEKKPRK